VPAARALAEEELPDIIVTDLAMGGNDRIALVEDLIAIAPAAHILVYSSSDEMVWARHALRAGARGYVSKAESLEVVAEAMDAIVSGAIHVSSQVRTLLVSDCADAHGPDVASLSSRELQILTLMGDGRSPQSLGAELGLSVKTIGSYRERLKIKLGLESMRMLDRFAVDHAARLAARS
jgi:DNA-binding NarL/FixJ family response regulator